MICLLSSSVLAHPWSAYSRRTRGTGEALARSDGNHGTRGDGFRNGRSEEGALFGLFSVRARFNNDNNAVDSDPALGARQPPPLRGALLPQKCERAETLTDFSLREMLSR